VPHAPQLVSGRLVLATGQGHHEQTLLVSTQLPEQHSWFAGHWLELVQVHAPLVHAQPWVHALPHVPQ